MPDSRFPSSVPEALPRIVAAQVLVIAVVALAFRQAWILPLLAADFALRAAIAPRLSPLAAVARIATRRMGRGRRRIPYASKRFAAAIGLAFAASASVLAFTGAPAVADGLIAVLAVFAGLEAGVGFCAGCVVYNGLVRHGFLHVPACPECAGLRPRGPFTGSTRS